METRPSETTRCGRIRKMRSGIAMSRNLQRSGVIMTRAAAGTPRHLSDRDPKSRSPRQQKKGDYIHIYTNVVPQLCDLASCPRSPPPFDQEPAHGRRGKDPVRADPDPDSRHARQERKATEAEVSPSIVKRTGPEIHPARSLHIEIVISSYFTGSTHAPFGVT